MSPEKRLRVAVVGAGRAGQARIRALEGHPRAELSAIVRRTGELGAPAFGDVLASETIDAVFICTPNLLHVKAVDSVLRAGKHVAVEFPLAPTAAVARELFARADEVGRVLHVEHIELLSPSQQFLRERARVLGRPRGGSVEFTGSLDGWLADPTLAGTPALCALARLHRILDLFGPARVLRAGLERLFPGWRLTAELRLGAGATLELRETRAPELPRATTFAVECERGLLSSPPPEPAGALFRADLDHFLSRIENAAPPYVPRTRILEALELVEAIERALA